MTYEYTLLKQDGTIEALGAFHKELPFRTETNQKTGEVTKGLYAYLNCTTIECIPAQYYENQDWLTDKETVCFGDEEGRFNNENHTNPHFSVLHDPDGGRWDCVGDIVRMVEL
jgi:hypothetical protein